MLVISLHSSVREPRLVSLSRLRVTENGVYEERYGNVGIHLLELNYSHEGWRLQYFLYHGANYVERTQ